MSFQNPLWQSSEWEVFQQQCGNKTLRIQDQLIIIRRTAFQKKFFELPRIQMNTLSNSFWNKLKDQTKERKIIFTRTFPADTDFVPLDKGDSGGFKVETKNIPEIFPEHTLIVDLTKSEEEMLIQMKQKGRYNIKLARKKGVEMKQSTDISPFYALLSKTTQRDGFTAHSRDVYEKMLESFGNNALLLYATYEGKIIAGGIFLISSDVMTYYYGASANEHRNVMAPYLLQWTAMQEAKQRGCRWFDFLGIAPEGDKKHRLSGVSQFKEKFGGLHIAYIPAFEIVHSKKWNALLRTMKKLRSIFH